MDFIEIKGYRYPVVTPVHGSDTDDRWDNRDSKTLHLAMTYNDAMELFTDNSEWSIVQSGEREVIVEKVVETQREVETPTVVDTIKEVTTDSGEIVSVPVTEVITEIKTIVGTEIQAEVVMEPYEEIYDNSEYCMAGPITDNRDGTVYVKMGKPTELELKNKELSEAEADMADEESLEHTVVDNERKRLVNDAIWKLPDEMRVAIHLVYFENLTYEETAKVMKKNRKQVENLVFRAKAAAKRELEKDFENEII